MLERRFRTIEISKGTKLDWVLQAIGEAASDGVGLNAQALTKRLRTYVDNARPQRPAEPKSSPELLRPRPDTAAPRMPTDEEAAVEHAQWKAKQAKRGAG